MDPRALRQRLEASAKALGFDAFGVAPVEVDVRAEYFRKWIADGMPRPKRLKMAKSAALAMAEMSAIPLE